MFVCFCFVFPFLLPCHLRLVGKKTYRDNHQPPSSFSAIQSRYTCIMTVNNILFRNPPLLRAVIGLSKCSRCQDPTKFWQKDRSKKWARPSKSNQKTDLTELSIVVSPSMNIKWETSHEGIKMQMHHIADH